MVASTAQLQPANGTRWLNYLVLSLLLNALFISLITMPPVSSPVATPERLAIKLKSRAAPPPAPAIQPTQPVANRPAPEQRKIVTETEAPKKLAVPTTRTVPEKVAAPVERKQTETAVKKVVPTEPVRMDKQPELRPETPVIPTRQSIPVATPAPLQQSMNKAISRQESTADDSGRDTATAVHEARYRKQVAPVYPRRALELGQQGTVTLHARVKPDGLPQELKVETTSGHSLLDKAALAAVEKWEFEPVIQDGVAITGWVRVPIEFVIQ